MKNLHFLLLLLLLPSAFCKKENTPVDVEEILIDGTWTQKEYLTDDDGDGVFTDASLPCQFGDGWKFAPNYSFELRDEIEYCNTDADSVAIIPGTWKLMNDDTEIYIEIESGFLELTLHIHSISDTLMELRIYNAPVTQAPLEERITLVR